MNNALRMDIDHRFDYLTYVDSCLELSESLSSFSQIFERIVSAVFKKDIDVLFVLKCINELDYVSMFE